ncbi:MAG: hypothetical protein ACTHK2_13890 [Dokdonella sp.]|uniref:hypothetical protein n=1 Tax=Dokdonella sp. TaxID=2291710 RepID=UPI003F7FB1B9
MSLDPRINRLRRAAVGRRCLVACALALPPSCALGVALGRAFGARSAIVFTVAAAIALGLVLLRLARAIDRRWLVRAIDARAPAMEDSTDLLLRDPAALAPLAALQRSRLQQRLDRLDLDLRAPWPWRAFGASIAVAVLLLAAVAVAPSPRRDAAAPVAASAAPGRASVTRMEAVELTIAPPPYTRLAERRETSLDAKAPQDSTLRWRLRFAPQPSAVALALHDGRRVELRRDGGDWRGEATLPASMLYRIVVDGAPALADDRLHRIDAIADAAPEIRVLSPDKTLTLADPQQKAWPLAFEASDDYGIARAELVVTHAQGNGENIAFKEQAIELVGTPAQATLTPPPAAQTLPASPVMPERADGGPRVVLRYTYALELAAFGFSMGDDVIAKITVTDNRAPKPNATRSPSLILRWPADPSKDSAGLEGIVQKTMPAYFRSQRQIIIDTQALLADQAQLDDAKFLARSDAIGVDQKLLRLRYGQFLGEESEGHAEHAPDGAIGDAATQAGALAGMHEAQEQARPGAPARFGDAGDVVAEYGHVHDIAEAATLLDPDTRATLKSALGEMWQAELHLRQGAPAQALPYEQRALEYIKQVQQATRIYLARVGLELPAPDEARRLSGERKDLADRTGSLAPAPAGDGALVTLWQALDGRGAADWDAAQRALAAHGDTPDVLGALAALDHARRETDCAGCRLELCAALWPLLPGVPAATATRPVPDAASRAYLDALQAPAVAR